MVNYRYVTARRKAPENPFSNSAFSRLFFTCRPRACLAFRAHVPKILWSSILGGVSNEKETSRDGTTSSFHSPIRRYVPGAFGGCVPVLDTFTVRKRLLHSHYRYPYPSILHALLRRKFLLGKRKGTESSLDQIPILAARSNVNPWALLLLLCPFICSLNPTPVHKHHGLVVVHVGSASIGCCPLQYKEGSRYGLRQEVRQVPQGGRFLPVGTAHCHARSNWQERSQ